MAVLSRETAVDKAVEILSDRWPLVATAAAALIGANLAQRLYNLWAVSCIPLGGAELGNSDKRSNAYTFNARKLYMEGYKKFKDGLFRLTTSQGTDVIVVSPKFLSELQKLPDDVVSISSALDERLFVKHTKLSTNEAMIIAKSVKMDLTPALVRLNPILAEEVAEAFRRELNVGTDWTPVNINQRLLRIVAMASGRIFIGPKLCHDEDYLDSSINYTIDVMTAVQDLHRMKYFRDLRAPYLESVKRINHRHQQAHDFLEPIIAARLEAERTRPEGYEKPDDMLQWLMEASMKEGRPDVKRIASLQLGLSFAAIHTTTLTTTNAFYNLASMPEIVPELRAEIKDALAETGGQFTSAALQKMKKLDSFLRETSRVDPAGFSSFLRKVNKTFTLSNGQVLPAGVLIEVPAIAIHHDEALFPDTSTFDPLRFYRARQHAEGEKGTRVAEAGAMNQFVSVTQSHLTFGFGRHACPGRFFAANEIKMIMSNAILMYDIRNPEGVEGRIPNREFGAMSIPDASKELLFRKIVE